MLIEIDNCQQAINDERVESIRIDSEFTYKVVMFSGDVFYVTRETVNQILNT